MPGDKNWPSNFSSTKYTPKVQSELNNQPFETLKNERFDNGFFEAMGGNQVTGWMGNMPFPGQGGFPGGNSIQQVSDSTTMFENLRWYYVSNFRQLLSEAYVELGLVKTVVDVPVDDALRGGVELKSGQLSEDQIKELQISLDRDDDITSIGWAAKWNRLFGGAGTLILTDDQDPIEPFDIHAIGPDTALEFRAVDMWELFWDKQNTEGYDPQIQSQDFEFYEYYSELIHKSRVMRMKGTMAPSFTRPFFRGWGVSIVEQLVRSINQYLKAIDLGFEVLDEFKLDVYKIKNLVNTLLTPSGTNNVQKRIQFANYQKNYQNAIVMDSEDDFDYKQLSFSGLAEAMDGIRMQVAADMRMPITKLFGTSVSKGFQSDQNDIENYNAMVEGDVRNKIKYDILRICEIKSQKLFGFVPDDLEIEFKPLRELTAVDQETVRTQKFARLLQARQAGELSTVEFREACNKGNLIDIKLDVEGLEDMTGGPIDSDSAKVAEESDYMDPESDLDMNDPGADREDTRSVEADIDTLDREPMMSPASKPKLPANPKDQDEQRLAMKKDEQNTKNEVEVRRPSISRFRKLWRYSHPAEETPPEQMRKQTERIPGDKGVDTEGMEDGEQKIRNPGSKAAAKTMKAKRITKEKK